MQPAREARRIARAGRTLSVHPVLRRLSATPARQVWHDTVRRLRETSSYVVQTATKVVERCILMTTRPGDLVLDPTCGSGTTAYVAEQWGRRWITIDTSRVPLALARQRLLTATFPYYELQDAERGPGWRVRVQAATEQRRARRSAGSSRTSPWSRLRTTSRRTRRCSLTGPRSTRRSPASPAPSWSRRRSRRRSTSTQTARRTRVCPRMRSYVDRMLEALRRSPVLQLGGQPSRSR